MRKKKSSEDKTCLLLRPTGTAGSATASGLHEDIRRMIRHARGAVAISVNATLTLLYWSVGRRIRRDILKEQRAEYGRRILPTLSAKLREEFGPGWNERNLAYMIRFAEVFHDRRILHTLCAKLGWSHFRLIVPIEDRLKRDFYAEMCRIEGWSSRLLRRKMDGMLYERTALSRKPRSLIRHEIARLKKADRLTPDLVFRDPYFLDFLGLRDRFLEKDLEDAIMREMEHFILELGAGFAFVARQKRITVDETDYHLDLLFYHRKLRRLVALDLKLERFKAEHKGQMELYLRWLDRHEREEGEDPPVGIILCAGKSDRHVELLELGKSGIHVAEYLTELPPRRLLEKKLLSAIEAARHRMSTRAETFEEYKRVASIVPKR